MQLDGFEEKYALLLDVRFPQSTKTISDCFCIMFQLILVCETNRVQIS